MKPDTSASPCDHEWLEELTGTFHRLGQSGIYEELLHVISCFEVLGGPAQQPRTQTLAQIQPSAEKPEWRSSAVDDWPWQFI